MRRTIACGGYLALACLALFAGCSNDSASGKTAPPVPQGVPVTVATVVQKSVPVQVRAIGTVQASSTVSIKSRVDGQVFRVHFTEGQDVKKGDLLFTIDPRPFEAALQQAEAMLARDMAQVAQAEATLGQRRAEATQAEANIARDLAHVENARVDAQRYLELLREGGVAQQQYDQVRTNAAAMEATVQATRAGLENARAAIRAAQAALETAKAATRADQAAVDNARIQLGYTTIRSPLDGRTGNLLVHPGALVKGNDASESSALVVINQVHPIYAAFSVPEQFLADIKRYLAAGSLRVEAILPGQERAPEQGTLTFVNNAVDPSTGTIQLKGTFANSGNRLWPGQFIDVVLTVTTEADAVVVLSQAIETGQQGSYVFVVKPDLTVDRRQVVVGRMAGLEAVVAKGLAPGERVVTEGQIRLVPGARVDVKPSPPAGAAPEKAG